jgi:hypothetical protein
MMTEHNGREVWRILFDAVTNTPDVISFHIGEVVSFQTGLKSLIKRSFRYFSPQDQPLLNWEGGELLTRCRHDLLPQRYVGAAFSEMPTEWMKEMFLRLLTLQLEFVANRGSKKGEFYSINLEALDNDLDIWARVCDTLVRRGNLPVNIEIKESEALSSQVMELLAETCEKTGIRIYVDDLCSNAHCLPEKEKYIITMISILHPFIQAVKIDYQVMHKIMYLTQYGLVKNNLESFRWLWESWCESPLPYVIFESMPREDQRWLSRLFELAYGYNGSKFQIG